MIRYPLLEKGQTFGITAPSSGVPTELHTLLRDACDRMKHRGYNVLCGETVWTENKVRSSSPRLRADEFNEMMQEESIHHLFPPWGGELLIEMLEYVQFNDLKNKWMIGFSDISLLLLAVTLKTGIATTHGSNLVNLRGEHSDDTTAMWEAVLSTEKGSMVQAGEWRMISDFIEDTKQRTCVN